MSARQIAAEEPGPQPDLDYPDEPAREPASKEDNHGELDTFDIFSLIVNRMIGTGVYTAPAAVYLMTEQKILTLGLWGIGFLYSVISMCIYLDYAVAFPFTGGELVYVSRCPFVTSSCFQSQSFDAGNFLYRNPWARCLDEITAYSGGEIPSSPFSASPSQRLAGDGILAYTVYSVLFVSIFNSGTNAMQFGRMVLLAINADTIHDPEVGDFSPGERHLLRFIGVVSLTALCMVQYLSPRSGRHLNTVWAVVKIAFVVGLILTGAVKAGGRGTFTERLAEWSESDGNDYQRGFVWANALLAVLFSFQGWENATFVTLISTEHSPRMLNNVVPILQGSCGTSIRAWAIVAAISSLGSLNSVIFTFSRVKQSIGDANILPWSDLWRSDHVVRHGDTIIDESPRGGLLLHWTTTVIVIAAVSGIDDTLNSVMLPGLLQTYTHTFVSLVLGAAFMSLESREKALGVEIAIKNVTRFSRKTGVWKIVVRLFVSVYMGLNLLILVFGAWTEAPAVAASNIMAPAGYSYPNWIYAAVLGALIAVGVVYYTLVFGAAARSYGPDVSYGADQPDGVHSQPGRIEESGLFRKDSAVNILQIARVRVVIFKDRAYLRTHERFKHERVQRFGRRWRAQYALRKDLRVCNGYQKTSSERSRADFDTQHPDAPGRNGPEDDNVESDQIYLNLLYSFFGGRRWLRETPWERFTDLMRETWRDVTDRFRQFGTGISSNRQNVSNGVNIEMR
ncbi:hypothetical protein LX36DRAFT_584345 [Colletotrichum falcatum]|nr:hypothetical protein LX36DRAFT_584345 [Colletotrichum falcatum]